MSRRALALLATLLVAFQAAEEEEVFRYDEPKAVIEGLEVRAPDAGRLERLEESLGERTWERVTRYLAERSVDHLGDFDVAGGWLVWDEAFEGNFDVLAVALDEVLDEETVPVVIAVAVGPEHAVRPRAAAASDGGAWITWEEGPSRWGRTYRSVDRLWNNVTSESGPLHSWSTLRLARLRRPVQDVDHLAQLEFVDVPMPAIAASAADEERRPGTEGLGVHYERPELSIDGEGALWLAYRHVHQAQLARKGKTRTHIERGFAVDLLRLTGDGFDGPYRLADRQRDGNQQVLLQPMEKGVRVLAEVGRRDRVKREGEPHWLAHEVRSAARRARALNSLRRREQVLFPTSGPRERAETDFEGRVVRTGEGAFTLLHGDLHRHTDLSLCFPFYDGSLDDAYRYARGPGGLDFVAITDHARDLDRGNVGGLPWDLSVRAADRYHEPGRFAAFYSYERSQGDTDHNVISLDADVLRPHQPPLRTFWEAYPGDRVITIPHATSHSAGARFCGNVWTKRDDDRRMLAEVYQSFRDVESFVEVTEKAHANGHPLGFIASSDHLSTSAAFACVWTKGEGAAAIDREPIFEGLRARRTFGATAKVVVAARSANAWMGEELEGDGPFPISVEARGDAPVARVEFWANGALAHAVERPAEGRAAWEWPGAPEDTFGWCSVVVRFEDGERAWASPFFARWDRAGARKR